MEYSVIKGLQKEAERLAQKRPPLPTEISALKVRLKRFAQRHKECLGEMPAKKYPLQPVIEEKVIFDDSGVVQERVIYHSEELVKVPAHVYYHQEAKGKKPGVLLLQGWESLGKYSFPFFKIRLAQEGFLVILPDNRCSGERRRESNSEIEQLNIVPVALSLGKTFMGMNTYDNIRAIDYLVSRGDVDPERIAVVGLCWGGMQAYNLAALDRRVGCCVAINANSTYRALIRHHITYSYHTCLGTYIPNLLKYGDTTDIYALIAPRPLLIANNANDNWFPLEGYQEICRELEGVYHAFGKPENFKHLLSSNLHDIVGVYRKEAIAWLNKHLKKSEEGGRKDV